MAPHLNIVVVEDHDMLDHDTASLLRGHGHTVLGFSCAEDVDEKIGSVVVDLFVIDTDLPGEDGISLTKRIRETSPRMGIVLLTARSQIEDKVTGYDSGADLYLTKPISPTELLAAISALARRMDAETPINQASEFRIDSRQRVLSGPNGDLSISSDEFAILSALARAAGNRLETWQILEAIGQELSRSSKASLEVRMVRLRKKFALIGSSTACIKSIRLSGYQLCIKLKIL